MIVEAGSDLAAELWATRHRVASSTLFYPEARAALAAARRGGRLNGAGHRRARVQLDSLYDEMLLLGIDAALARHAGQLAEDFGLRGYDAVHLASALAAGGAITFVSWDAELAQAAAQSGCAIAPAP